MRVRRVKKEGQRKKCPLKSGKLALKSNETLQKRKWRKQKEVLIGKKVGGRKECGT